MVGSITSADTATLTADAGSISDVPGAILTVANQADLSGTSITLGDNADTGSNAADAILDGYRVNGTGGNDQILVGIPASGQRFQIDGVESLQVYGKAGNDTILNDTTVTSLIAGGDGDDSLTGGIASDVIFGGDGTDSILGEAGNDYLFPDHAFDLDTRTTEERIVSGEIVLYDVAGNRLLHSTPNDTGARPGYLFGPRGEFLRPGRRIRRPRPRLPRSCRARQIR